MPSAPPMEITEADSNHNEINSNYLPSMESTSNISTPRLYPNLQDVEEDIRTLDRGLQNPVQDLNIDGDSSGTHFFDAEFGFMERDVRQESNSRNSSSHRHLSSTGNVSEDVSDAVTEAAQNHYNAQVEQIMLVKSLLSSYDTF